METSARERSNRAGSFEFSLDLSANFVNNWPLESNRACNRDGITGYRVRNYNRVYRVRNCNRGGPGDPGDRFRSEKKKIEIFDFFLKFGFSLFFEF